MFHFFLLLQEKVSRYLSGRLPAAGRDEVLNFLKPSAVSLTTSCPAFTCATLRFNRVYA